MEKSTKTAIYTCSYVVICGAFGIFFGGAYVPSTIFLGLVAAVYGMNKITDEVWSLQYDR